MENNAHLIDDDSYFSLAVLETVRPSGLLHRVKQWLSDFDEECRNNDFEVDPLLDFPRDF